MPHGDNNTAGALPERPVHLGWFVMPRLQSGGYFPGTGGQRREPSASMHIHPAVVVGFLIVLFALYWWSTHPAFRFLGK